MLGESLLGNDGLKIIKNFREIRMLGESLLGKKGRRRRGNKDGSR